MKTLKQIRQLTEGEAEQKIVQKQQSINKIIDAFRIGKLKKSEANARLREKGHRGLTEAKKGKSLKIFRGSRTATGEQPNPIETEPKLKLGKSLKAMSHKGY